MVAEPAYAQSPLRGQPAECGSVPAWERPSLLCDDASTRRAVALTACSELDPDPAWRFFFFKAFESECEPCGVQHAGDT